MKAHRDRSAAGRDGVLVGYVLPAYVAIATVVVALAGLAGILDGVAPGHEGSCFFHAGAALSGDAGFFETRVAPGCAELSAAGARDAVVWDFAFVLVYASLGTALLAWLWPRAWRLARVRRGLRGLVYLPLATGVFDVVENVFVLLALRSEGPLSLAGPAVGFAAAAGWWKWLLALAALASTVVAAFGALANGGGSSQRDARPTGAAPPLRDDAGICVSGPGMRGAGFALGALRALERRKVLQRARWLAAVSGGAYAAGAWYVARTDGPRDRLLDPPAGSPDLVAYVRRNARYLATGRGGIGATVVGGGLLAAVNVAIAAALVCLVAWPAGWFASSWLVQPDLRLFDYAAVSVQSLWVDERLWLPGLAGLGLAGVPAVVSLFLWERRRRVALTCAAALAGGGVLLLTLLVALPVGLAELPKLPAWVALGVAVVAGIAAAVATARGARRAARLLAGGPVVAFGLKVATDAAYRAGVFAWSPRALVVLAAVFGAFCAIANPEWWSSFRVHFHRLRSTFATTSDRSERAAGAPPYAGLYPLAIGAEPAWAEYSERPGPKLVVCAAALRGDVTVPFRFPEDATALPRPLGTVSAASALSGAPRRLGAWVPRHGAAERPGLGYLFKKAFGIHDPDDPLVYVTGGDDALALVELVRRRCKWIFCADGNGDGRLAREAVERAALLARIECGAEIELDLGPPGEVPERAVRVGLVRYHSCGGTGRDACETGLVFYGSGGPSRDAPISTLSLSPRRRRSAPDELDDRLRLGEWVGRALTVEYERLLRALATGASEDLADSPALLEAYERFTGTYVPGRWICRK